MVQPPKWILCWIENERRTKLKSRIRVCQSWSSKDYLPNLLEIILLHQIFVDLVRNFKFWSLAYFLILVVGARLKKLDVRVRSLVTGYFQWDWHIIFAYQTKIDFWLFVRLNTGSNCWIIWNLKIQSNK